MKNTNTTISSAMMSVKIPFVIKADDYHEFNYLLDIFNGIGMKLKMKELSPEDFGIDHGYFAVYYRSKCPTQEILKDLMKKF